MAGKWTWRGGGIAGLGIVLVLLFSTPFCRYGCAQDPALLELFVGPVPPILRPLAIGLGAIIVLLGVLVSRIPSGPAERDHVPSEREVDDWPAGEDPPE
jgi:hypothetical protein